MNNTDYWNEVVSSASYIWDQAIESLQLDDQDWEYDRDQVLEKINDDGLIMEYVDAHQWIIYYSYNMDIIQHTDNCEYLADNIGGLDEIAKKGTLSLFQAIAFWAFYADIYEAMDQAIDEYENNLDD